MNRNKSTHLIQMRWSRIAQPAGLALLIAAGAAWSANDLDTPNPRGTTHPDGSNTYNTEWLGHNDLQGRTVYQTTVHTQGDRVIAYAGHFAGQMLNPMTGATEENGTSIVDVTDPRNPKYLKHLIANQGGARMVKLCDGNDLPHGARNHTYLLRENGAVSHEVWDVTEPASPILVSTPVSGLDVTHRNWWDCKTGIAYIVGGATKPPDPAYDGWNNNSSPNQHLKIYDLGDPAHPKYIMDFGYPGQNPGSTFLMPGTETTTKTVPPGVHGPIVVSTFNGETVNRLYMPYGVGSDGIIQINDLTKVLPPPYGTGSYANPARPTGGGFHAGFRVPDLRDPYHPREVAHFIAPVNKFTQPSSAVINGVTYTALDVSCDNTDVDNRGLRYCGDRVGGGLDIVRLTGEAARIAQGDADD